MNNKQGKENQNVNQTPMPEYHSTGDDVISELVKKYAEQILSTNTPILSYEATDSPSWIKLLFKRIDI